MSLPKISILMNCFNGEEYLVEALESILNQTYNNWEIIFWDNRSIDKSAKIFQSYDDKRLKYFLSPSHSNLGEARRRAFNKAQGEYVAVLDVDDLWEKDKLEKQIRLFEDKTVGIVISNVKIFNDKKEKPFFKSLPPSGYVFDNLLSNYYICLPSLIVRKYYVDMLDYHFDDEFDYISDFDFILRLSKKCKLIVCKEILAGWRVHGKNDTFKSPYKFVEETKKWIKKQTKNNIIDIYENKKSLEILKNKNNRQILIFKIINNEKLSFLKLFINQNNKNWKDFLLLMIMFLPNGSKILRYFYLKRISFGLN